MKNAIFCLAILAISSCELLEPNHQSISTDQAIVQKIQGLNVYILSEPLSNYRVIGKIENDFFDQAADATKGRDVLKKILNTTTNNVDFQKLLNNMVNSARQQYPTSQGIIFRNNLSNCEAIEFQ